VEQVPGPQGQSVAYMDKEGNSPTEQWQESGVKEQVGDLVELDQRHIIL